MQMAELTIVLGLFLQRNFLRYRSISYKHRSISITDPLQDGNLPIPNGKSLQSQLSLMRFQYIGTACKTEPVQCENRKTKMFRKGSQHSTLYTTAKLKTLKTNIFKSNTKKLVEKNVVTSRKKFYINTFLN